MINTKQLTEELIVAGIQTNGCNSNGVVWDKSNNEIQSRPEVKAVLSKHIPIETKAESLEERIIKLETSVKSMKVTK